ncbi:hypothetical protein ILUMI_06557 [Ignelater luminosus]|uniref:DDE-1 domain-containing protein n=1 Tax=Ignelater luminosus TaxID=2038154 RepID=A0A8K0DA13_IGNLU|nr:hypothetical protein ILUMI_06557 [Ignelater luminosus]
MLPRARLIIKNALEITKAADSSSRKEESASSGNRFNLQSAESPSILEIIKEAPLEQPTNYIYENSDSPILTDYGTDDFELLSIGHSNKDFELNLDSDDALLDKNYVPDDNDVLSSGASSEERPLSNFKAEVGGDYTAEPESENHTNVISAKKNTNTEKNNILDTQEPKKKTRKRLRNEANWKQNIKKRRVNTGQSYISEGRKHVPAKTLKPPCQVCRFKCDTEFTQAERQGGTKARVCKKFFMNTLVIGDKFIRTIWAKAKNNHAMIEKDKRGNYKRIESVSSDINDIIRKHINSFTRIDSHYLRAQTTREFLDESLTVAHMYRFYKQEQEQAQKTRTKEEKKADTEKTKTDSNLKVAVFDLQAVLPTSSVEALHVNLSKEDPEPLKDAMGKKPKEHKIGTVTAKQMSAAVDLVLKDNYSIHAAAEKLNIKFQTLHRYVTKKQRNPDIPLACMAPNYAVRRIFSAEQEDELDEYITKCSKVEYGTSTKECQKLAFEMAIRNNIKVQDSWNVCKRIRQVADGNRIFNPNESGVTIAHKSRKILAENGSKQVNQCTSAERGVLVTICSIVSTAGTYLPPALVFPRKYFKAHMLAGAPTGSLGLANTSGWMTSDLFIQVLDNFIKFTNSCSENPTLLIYDNESHISLATVEKARKFGVRILTNPGIPMTIYQVAECVGEAHPKAFTPANIIAGFKKSEIYPLNRSVFSKADFLNASVTDRPIDLESPSTSFQARKNDDLNEETNKTNLQCDSTDNTENTDGKRSTDFVSPAAFRGFPKAASRKTNQKPQQWGKSKIITDSPEKHSLIEKEKEKQLNTRKGMKKTKRVLADHFCFILDLDLFTLLHILKSSIQECLDLLLLYAENAGEISRRIENQKKAAAIRKIVGSIKRIEQAYVVIDTVKYQVEVAHPLALLSFDFQYASSEKLRFFLSMV